MSSDEDRSPWGEETEGLAEEKESAVVGGKILNPRYLIYLFIPVFFVQSSRRSTQSMTNVL